jgi:two-component system, OmpR family, response regulator
VLSAREFALMLAFLERPGTILSRGQLEDRLYGWGKEVESKCRRCTDPFRAQEIRAVGDSHVRGLGWTVMPGDTANGPAS